jgi:hypothetical protein
VGMSPQPRDRAHLGVALSGGGHRAALFAAGALMALVDMGVNRDIVSVASVSGGSITNGLAAKGCDLADTDREELEAALTPGIRAFTHDGLFFPGKPTNGFVSASLVAVGVAVGSLIGWVLGTLVHVGLSAVADTRVMAIVAISTLAAVAWLTRSLPARFRVATVLGFGLGLLVVGGGMWWLSDAGGGMKWLSETADVKWWPEEGVASRVVLIAGLLVFASTYLLAVWVLGRRSKVLDAAMHCDLFDEALLPSVDRSPHHVFCATDLLTANHGYLSPRIVYSYKWGLGVPAPSLRLSTAVQASACFPGGFPPRRLRRNEISTDPLKVDVVELIDGGVYDNMGDEWEFGWDAREDAYGPALAVYQPSRAGTLIVVNAGGVWRSVALPRWGIRREVASLSKCSGIQHAITTSLRRRYLVDRFTSAKAGELTGALVHIDQSPRRVPERYQDHVDLGARAALALALLDKLDITSKRGEAMRKASAGVGTVLSPLGVATAAALMWHAYLLTRINAYVLLGLGSLPADVSEEWTLQRFTDLAASN